MKPKQSIILSLILGILALGIFLKSWVRPTDDAGSDPRSEVAIAAFDPEKVERILISNGTQPPSVELVKEKGSWKVKSLWDSKADPVMIKALIQKLCSVRGELRGTGKKLFPDFEIQDTEAFSLRFLGAEDALLADLRLGKKRAGEEGYFIRKAMGENVYLVDLNMAELMGIHQGLDETTPLSSVWADLSLFNLDPEKITKITIHHIKGNEQTMVLGLLRVTDPKDPIKSSWEFMRKDMTLPIDPGKVLKYIAMIISIKAKKVVDPKDMGPGLVRLQPELKDGSILAGGEAGKPVWQLFVTQDDKEAFLKAGPKAEKEDLYYVTNSSGASVFALEAGYFDDLDVNDTHFVIDASPLVDPKENLQQNDDGQAA